MPSASTRSTRRARQPPTWAVRGSVGGRSCLTSATLPARPSRKARSAPWRARVALRRSAAISDSMNRPSVWRHVRRCAAARASPRSSTSAHCRQILLGQRQPLARPSPRLDQVLRQADGQAFVGVEARGRSASCRSCAPRRSAAACAPSRRRRRRCRAGLRAGRSRRVALGHADVRRRGELQPAADDGAVQHRDHRHRPNWIASKRRMPHARMQHAFVDVALGQFGQVQPGAEVLRPRR